MPEILKGALVVMLLGVVMWCYALIVAGITAAWLAARRRENEEALRDPWRPLR